jgi:hypothetical protein
LLELVTRVLHEPQLLLVEVRVVVLYVLDLESAFLV